jgi:hypothetical protein
MNFIHKSAIGVALLSIALSSCDSILDKEPLLSTTESTIFSDSSKVEANLLGIYSKVKGQLAYRGRAYQDVRGDDVVDLTQNVSECYTVYEMAVSLTSEDNSDTWSQLYTAINEANTFLSNMEKAKSVVGNKYNRYVSEAKFLRALSYYNLNVLYSYPYKTDPNALSVPLRLKPENTTGDNDLARSTVSEVFAQILDDLSDENISYLPEGGDTYEGITRASKGAAHILRQRIYMEEENWEKAVAEGEAVTGYDLENSVAYVFNNSINKESIFSFPMADTNKGTTQTAQAYYYCTGNIFILDDSYGYLSKPNYSLSSDTRIKDLVVKKSDKYLLNKYPDSKNYLDWVPQFRYAEVLLNLAECHANLGHTDKARQYLKQVRHRSVAADSDPLNIDKLSGNALLQAIYDERRAEFVGEGLRSIDIHRRAQDYVKRNGTFTISSNGYVWPIPTSERSANSLITD